MKLRIWETIIISIGFVFLYDCVETKLLTKTKTKKGASTNAGHKIITKRAFIQGRQNSPSIYVKHQSSKHKHHARSGKFKKRYISKSTMDVSRNKFASMRKLISRGSPTNSYSTGGHSELRRPVNLQKINQNTTYRRRKIIPDLLNAPTSFKRWDLQAPEEAEEGLDKRSRNRVKLNMQWPHFRQAKSHISEKHDILNKKTRVSNGVGARKRQRISGGVVHMDGPPPSELVGGTPVEMPDAGMRMAENANGLVLNSMAEMPKHAFYSSRFHTPAVHRFFPVEHRYDNGPIHKYLSSPVMLRAPHREGFPFADGGGGPFGGPPIASMFQGPPAPGHHVVIVNRPVKTPFPVPVQGPSRFVFVHHPVPMPPERVPVPVPVMVQRQGHQPIIIVHHKEYSGPVIDPCGVNPCRNGGTCSAVGSEFKCVCPVGYKSERCEVQSKCSPNPCKNFGKCTELSDDYECTCHTGFHGKSCDLESKCEPNPCRNGGVCTENVESYICSCSAGFMGKNCEQESKCLPVNPCKNSGVCTEDIGGYKCNCKDGYAGINCEVRETTSACDSNPCHNGATCIVETYDSSKFSCYCAHGYNGLDCLDAACSNCPSPGKCVEGVCSLDYGNSERSFSHLGLSSSPCGSVNPCLFGGHCVRNGGEYSCLCPDGRSGSHCEHFYQESVCGGCHHHAVCISSKCTCREGYTGDGKTCKPKMSHCHPNPCENGGSCHEDETAGPNDPEWWCECLKGYSGTHCHEYDPCASYKCHNGGKCETVNSEPRCRCEAPFEGPTCLDDNFCLPRDGVNRNPCKNGGKCEFVNSEVTCVCPIEYEGPRCNINKCDKCAKNAFCEKGICKCRPPYSGNGLDCELDQAAPPVESYTAPNYCDSNPCHNGATCVDGKATFYCACKEDTFGRLCEKSTAVKPTVSTPKAVCHPNPCLNGGMCKETGANQDFDCICPNARYKGRFCDVDMCAECDPHARCINGKCFCRKGFIGDGYSCKKEKPKCSGCPEFATCVGGNQCICNPGFSMGASGKRTCIPIVESLPVVPTVKHEHEGKAAIPVSEANPTARTGQWSEDIIVTEYRNLGCWSDTTDWRNPSQRALMVMEGLDPLLAGDYRTRKQPISKCADVAKRLGFRVFAIQNGGQCFGGSDDTSYKKYGQSEKCLNGVGGSLANDVYKL